MGSGAADELRWDDRVVVITGAGRNLGRAYALLLAARGAKVIVNDLGVAISDTDGSGDAPAENPAHEVVAAIVAAGGEAVANTDSVATEAGGEAIIATALDTYGRVDALVNNAGVVRQSPFEDYADELLWPVLESQIGGHFHVTRPAWRAMQAQGYGRVLNLSSGAGLWGVPTMTGYSAAKMAIVGLTRALAQEGEPHGITVNAIAPVREDSPGWVRADPRVARALRLALAGRRRARRDLARPRGLPRLGGVLHRGWRLRRTGERGGERRAALGAADDARRPSATSGMR